MTTRNICILYLPQFQNVESQTFAVVRVLRKYRKYFALFQAYMMWNFITFHIRRMRENAAMASSSTSLPGNLPPCCRLVCAHGPISTGVLLQHHRLVPLSPKIYSKFEFFFGYLFFTCTPYVMEMISKTDFQEINSYFFKYSCRLSMGFFSDREGLAVR